MNQVLTRKLIMARIQDSERHELTDGEKPISSSSSAKPFRAFEVLDLGRFSARLYSILSAGACSRFPPAERRAEQAPTPKSGSKLPHSKRALQKAQWLAQKKREFRDLILKTCRAEPLPDAGFFHGKSEVVCEQGKRHPGRARTRKASSSAKCSQEMDRLGGLLGGGFHYLEASARKSSRWRRT